MTIVRFRVIFVIALTLLALFLVVWRFRPHHEEGPMVQSATPAKEETGTERAPSARASTDERQHKQSPATTISNTAWQGEPKASQFQLAVAAKNVPIDFWGKVVDQNDQPLSGVRVVMRIRQWSYDTNTGPGTLSPRREVASDAGGKFEWTGASGDSLELESVTKEGYRMSPKAQTGFAYGHNGDSFQPAEATPFLIRMWRLTPPENLVSFHTLFGFSPDGRAYTMDLLANKKFEGEKPDGDLLVKITRAPKVEPQQKYDWILEFDAINGGLAEAVDEFGYMAPEVGYQSKVTIQARASDTNWTDSVTKNYFIRSRGGAIYGLLHLRIRSEYDGQSAIMFETRLNPGGSRNLQP